MKDSDYVKSKSVNPLYLMIGKVNGYIEKKDGSKFSVFNSADKSKEILKNDDKKK